MQLRALALPAICLALIASSSAAQTPRSGPTESISLTVHEGTLLSFDLSPDGRTIVFDLLGQLWEMPSSGGEARPVTDGVRDTAQDLDPSYAPDGRGIVFWGERAGRTGLWLLEAGGAARQLTQRENPSGYDGNAAWSPDGASVAFARLLFPDSASPRNRTRIFRYDLASGTARELAIPAEAGPSVRGLAWNPDSKRFAVISGLAGSKRGGRIWLVDDSARARPFTPESSSALAAAFSPDGQRLAWLAPDSAKRTQVWVQSLDSRADALCLTSKADVAPTHVRWTPDGRRLLYSADGRFWMVPAEGGGSVEIPFTATLSFTRARRMLPPARFPEPGKRQSVRAFMGLALSPDATRVAMLALGNLWIMPVGGTPRAIAEVPLSARGLAWSPDGASLAWSAGRAGAENLFTTEVRSGTNRQLTDLPGRETAPVFSPDGRRLAFVYEPSEDSTFVQVVETGAPRLQDRAQSWAYSTERGAEVKWAPGSDRLLLLTGGSSPNSPTGGTIVPLSGTPRPLAHMPDSPVFLDWANGAIVFVRHARLWRAPFDSTGVSGPAEVIGGPAMYPTLSRDGTVLYLTDGGLRLRFPDGRERRLGWPLGYTPPLPKPLLIRNVRIIDGTGKPATAPQDLLVRRGRISRIAAAGTLVPGTAEVLDAGGRFLIPGLMDLHAHEYRPELLPGFAYFGVTTIRDQGSAIGPLVATADAIAAGKMNGPRVDYGGFQFYSDWAYDAEDQQGVEPEADSGHAARAVEMASAFGSQHIKTRTFRRWDINARLIREAHRRGMRVTGHCSHLLPLVAAGMDAKEHAGFCEPRSDGIIYEDLVQLYRVAGIGVVPTIAYSSFAVRINQRPDLLDGDTELAPFVPERNAFNWMRRLNADGREEFAEYSRYARLATARLAAAGVTIGTGTDIWQIPTGVHLELEELVAAGLSPLEAIRAATTGSARIVGAEQDLGSVTVGKLADLVILDADPVADIRNSRRIWAVLQAGRVLDRTTLVQRLQHRQ